MEERFDKHPAYQNEDLEIKTDNELEEAKRKAGATSHENAMKRSEMADKNIPGKETLTVKSITDYKRGDGADCLLISFEETNQKTAIPKEEYNERLADLKPGDLINWQHHCLDDEDRENPDGGIFLSDTYPIEKCEDKNAKRYQKKS